MTWGSALLGAGLFVWCFLVGWRIEGGVKRWLIRQSGPSTRRSVGVTLLVHLAMAGVIIVLTLVGVAAADAAGDSRAAAWITVPAIAALGPLVVCFLPATIYFPGHDTTSSLPRLGATRAQARVIGGLGGTFAVFEFCAAFVLFLFTFDPP